MVAGRIMVGSDVDGDVRQAAVVGINVNHRTVGVVVGGVLLRGFAAVQFKAEPVIERGKVIDPVLTSGHSVRRIKDGSVQKDVIPLAPAQGVRARAANDGVVARAAVNASVFNIMLSQGNRVQQGSEETVLS